MTPEERQELKAEVKRELRDELGAAAGGDAGSSGGGLSRRRAVQALGAAVAGYGLSGAVGGAAADVPDEVAQTGSGSTNDSDTDESGNFETLRAEMFQTVPQVRERATEGSGTKADPYAVPSGLLDGYAGLVNFGRGWFEADGLATDESLDYDESSVYLQGDGIRTTTLHHAADSPNTPTVLFRGSGGGNFGGIRDMTVYGAGEGDESGTASIVASDGDTIDLQFENVIIRYGGEHGIYLPVSSSGSRVVNCWIEQVGDTCLYIDGGTRIMVDNLHALGGRGIYQNGIRGEFSNIALKSLRGRTGIRLTGRGNHITDAYVYGDADRGLFVSSGRQFLCGIHLVGCDRSGLLTAAPIYARTIVGWNWGANYGHLIRVLTDSCRLSNVWGAGADETFSTSLAQIDGDYNYVDGIGGVAGTDWGITVAGGTKNVLDRVANVRYEDVTDRGYCTLINRWGTNDGNPSVSGQWNGESAYAGRMGATVWDTSTDPWTAYRSPPTGGDWIPLST